MTSLRDWYSVHFDANAITLRVHPPNEAAWEETLQWKHISRVCFKAADWFESDELYIFTDQRPESYVIPIEADGGQALWGEILDRKLFDAEMAIEASMATNELFCSPPISG
ncbi:MAG: hypothetical protein KDI79_07195 [Anaerolineae bacterium]|nr:hypothetical protein [Anaerolineae bacterium]